MNKLYYNIYNGADPDVFFSILKEYSTWQFDDYNEWSIYDNTIRFEGDTLILEYE